MSRQLAAAFFFSLTVHAAVVCVCPAPHADDAGQGGKEQDLTVLGVVHLSVPCASASTIPASHEPLAEHDEPRQKKDYNEHLSAQEASERRTRDPDDAPSLGVVGRPGAQVLSKRGGENLRSSYLRVVMQRLEEAKRYPLQAYRQGMEGVADIAFTISANGDAIGVRLHKSSRHNVLDVAAKKMVMRASPFHPIPRELDMKEMRIVVPVEFKIQGKRGR